MLSIGKLAAGQAKYYLDQAEGRVDVVESVGDGVEDYYLGASEARGRWIGAGAAPLALVGGVSGERLRQVLDGLDGDGRSLRDSSSAVRVAGFDLTLVGGGARARRSSASSAVTASGCSAGPARSTTRCRGSVRSTRWRHRRG